MNIVTVKDFPLSQYYPTSYTKKRVCLHHTQGYTVDGAITWWRETPDRVGTAWCIEKDGTVFKVFNDNFYAYQFGLKGVAKRTEYEQSTIGIELVNLGGLIKIANGTFCDVYGKPYKGEVFDAGKTWRGYRYWQPYTDSQYHSLADLLLQIEDVHDINVMNICESIEFDISVFESKFTVINHANVRRDKTDLSPAFDFTKLRNHLATSKLL